MRAPNYVFEPMEVDDERNWADEDFTPEKPKQESMTRILDLPQEMIFAIFAHLGVADKGNAAQTCSSWRDIINDPFLWREAEVEIDLDNISPAALDSLQRKGIRRVVVGGGRKMENLGELLHLPTLESLKVSKLGPLQLDLVKKVFSKSLPRLKELHIRCHDSDQHEELFVHLNSLKVLRFCDDPRAFPAIVLNLKQPEVLKFDFMPFPGGSCLDLQVLLSSSMASLTQLCIEYFRVGDKDFEYVKEGLPNLRTICFTLSRTATEHSLRLLGQMPSLEKVRLRCDLMTDTMMRHIGQELANITVLHLLPCVSAYGAGLLSIRMPNLHELLFQFPSDTTLKFISTGCTNLKKLSLQYTGHVTDSGINFIASMSNLEHLTMDCSQIDDKQLEHLCHSLPRLQSLELAFCFSISCSGMRAVASMANLKTISLFHCKVDDSGIECLCRGSCSLENFRVWECPISDEALRSLARFCKVSGSFQPYEDSRCFV